MRDELTNLTERFENERWLLLENSLSDDEQIFWLNKIKEFPELREMFNEAENAINELSGSIDIPLGEEKFMEIIETAVSAPVKNESRESVFQRITNLFGNTRVKSLRPAFALFTIALVVMFYFYPANEKENVKFAAADLSWNGSEFADDITKVKSKMIFAKDDETSQIYFRYLLSDEWKSKVFLMNKEINRLKSEILNF